MSYSIIFSAVYGALLLGIGIGIALTLKWQRDVERGLRARGWVKTWVAK